MEETAKLLASVAAGPVTNGGKGKKRKAEEEAPSSSSSAAAAAATTTTATDAQPAAAPSPAAPASSSSPAAAAAAAPSSSSGAADAQKKKKKAKRGSRFDSSLGLLTQKFVELMRAAPDGRVDLNDAARELEVQKRRIYDITNVLEGIGLIEKKSKNTIRWRGSSVGPVGEMEQQMAALNDELLELGTQEGLVDDYIQRMQGMLRELGEERRNAELAYVTHEDIRSLDHLKNETLIAIKAPSGTTLEVPDPDEGMAYPRRRYQIYLKSSGGPIDVYLVSNPDDGSGAMQQEPATQPHDDSGRVQPFPRTGLDTREGGGGDGEQKAREQAAPAIAEAQSLLRLQPSQENPDFFQMDSEEGIAGMYGGADGKQQQQQDEKKQ